jgi:putative ABC transport system permease protein
MSWFRRVRRRFQALFCKEEFDARVDEEIRSHIEMETQSLVEAGMDKVEAHKAALRQFGWIESVKDTCRDQRGVRWMEDFGQDVRFGCRMLRKNLGLSAAAVLTLALGIGGTTAMFSLIHAALLRDLPFPKAGELVVVWAENPSLQLGMTQIPPANADVAAWREQTSSFTRIAAFAPRTADLADVGDPERVGAAGITAGFFETLGVQPLLGKTLALNEEMPGRFPVTLISWGLWQRRFGGDAAIVGKSISIDGARRTVIGILPAEFDFPRGAEWPTFFPFAGRTDVWLPLAFRAQDDGTGGSNWQSRDERGLVVIGRLKPGIGVSQAQAEMTAFYDREAKDHPETHKGWKLKVIPLRKQLAGRTLTALVILFAAVGLLLLIASVNVANLLLARGVARQQEMTVRAALGARSSRLVRQVLAECVLLGAIGTGVGLLIALGCLRAFLALYQVTHSRLEDASLNPTSLGFAVVITVMTSIMFGLLPAIQASRIDLARSIQASGRGEAGAIREGVRAWLVAAEVALALVLLMAAGLMVRSFLRVQAVHPGFRYGSVLTVDLQLPGARYSSDSSKVAFFQQLISRLEALPGISASGAISYLPLSGGENMGSFVVEGEPPSNPGKEPSAERRWVIPGYFAAMGIPIRKGRVFTFRDSLGQPPVLVVNDTLARQFFGLRDPVGHRLRVAGDWRTVVGVVSDVKSASLESDVRPQIYLAYAQDPWPPMTIVLRTEVNPLAAAPAVRGELKSLDPLLPAANMRSMEQVVSNATSTRRFNMALLAFFAVTALFLTITGIYGVAAFLVGRRRREIGIRMALGAQRRDILRLVLQQGMRPVALGSLAGIAGCTVATRFVASQLYSISTSDPLTIAVILSLLFATALMACWFPARRAADVHPIVALRDE